MDSAEFYKTRFKVGLFAVIFILVTFASLLMFAIKKDLFESLHTFTLLSRTGEELREGMPVFFSGFRIGVVSDLALNDAGHVLATVKIPERHAQWVRGSSTFTLEKPFIGETKIVLESKNLASGPPYETQLFVMGVVDDINEVIKRTRPIIDRLDRIAGNIENITREAGTLNQSLSQINAISAKLAKKSSLLEMATDDKQAVLALNQSLRQMPKLIEHYEALSADMQGLVRDAKHDALGPKGSIMRVNRLLDQLLVDLEKIDAEQLNQLFTNAARASADVATSTEDLQLLRRQIDESIVRWNRLLKKANDVIPGSKQDAGDLP